jgi:hypothetical protein
MCCFNRSQTIDICNLFIPFNIFNKNGYGGISTNGSIFGYKYYKYGKMYSYEELFNS